MAGLRETEAARKRISAAKIGKEAELRREEDEADESDATEETNE